MNRRMFTLSTLLSMFGLKALQATHGLPVVKFEIGRMTHCDELLAGIPFGSFKLGKWERNTHVWVRSEDRIDMVLVCHSGKMCLHHTVYYSSPAVIYDFYELETREETIKEQRVNRCNVGNYINPVSLPSHIKTLIGELPLQLKKS